MTNIFINLKPNESGKFVYYPGNLLKGTVQLVLDHVKKIRGFYIIVHGQARAHWTETRSRTTGSGKNRRTTTYTVHLEGKEVYVNSKTYFIGASGAQAQDIQPGTHRFEFECQLPHQLPYTFDAVHGNIGYYVEAVLDIPWSFDKEIKTHFTVVRYDDLSMFPELRIAAKNEKIKTFCCFCCASGPFFMSAMIPCTGYTPGQTIPVKVEYNNQSDVKVEKTKIKLKRVMHFTSFTPEHKTKTVEDGIVEIYKSGVLRNQKKEIDCGLDIPSILANSLTRYCNVIRVEYVLKVEAMVAGCHSNIELLFPIAIGSTPILIDNGYVPTVPVGLPTSYPDAPNGQPNSYPSAGPPFSYGIDPSAPPNGPPFSYPVAPNAPSSGPPFSYPNAPPAGYPSAPMENEKAMDDLPPSFDEAVNMIKPKESAPLIPASTSDAGPVGWNLAMPSAPSEKS